MQEYMKTKRLHNIYIAHENKYGAIFTRLQANFTAVLDDDALAAPENCFGRFVMSHFTHTFHSMSCFTRSLLRLG